MNLPNSQSIPFPTLISDIENGKIKIPQFQREFVWDIKKVAKLIDSLIKGFPIGTFIIWKTKEQLKIVRNLGGIQLPNSPQDDYINYVLDGQQRLTSIYSAINGLLISNEKSQQDFSKIYIDLTADKDQQIVITNMQDKEHNKVISINDLIHRNFIELSKYPEEFYDKINEYKMILQSYPISVTYVNEVNVDTAIEMYTRINMEAKTLGTFEIMVAKTFSVEKNFDLSQKYKELMKRLKKVNYETINNSVILQTIAILLGKDCSQASIYNLNKNSFIDIWYDAIDSIEMAIDYFRGFYRIPVSSILPYDALLIPFAYFFYRNKNKPNKVQQTYLQDFFWRTALTERYSHSQETRVTQDIIRINQIINEKRPIYDYSVNIESETIISNGYFTSIKKSYVKAILCLYMYFEPKSFNDNSKINVCNDWLKRASSRNYHHFFPISYLRKIDISESMINNVLNITIVDEHLNKSQIGKKSPSMYISRFMGENQYINETLKTHLINDIHKYGILSDNYERFLKSRAKSVSNELKKRIIF